jgi:hypothetical protein
MFNLTFVSEVSFVKWLAVVACRGPLVAAMLKGHASGCRSKIGQQSVQIYEKKY